jgi:hypothetical protein
LFNLPKQKSEATRDFAKALISEPGLLQSLFFTQAWAFVTMLTVHSLELSAGELDLGNGFGLDYAMFGH